MDVVSKGPTVASGSLFCSLNVRSFPHCLKTMASINCACFFIVNTLAATHFGRHFFIRSPEAEIVRHMGNSMALCLSGAAVAPCPTYFWRMRHVRIFHNYLPYTGY